MGIMVNKEDDKNAELSRRISADLRGKAGASSRQEANEAPDLAEDAEYVKDFSQTSRYAWVWVVLGLAVVVGLVVFGVTR